jgi:hypothetical protein
MTTQQKAGVKRRKKEKKNRIANRREWNARTSRVQWVFSLDVQL